LDEDCDVANWNRLGHRWIVRQTDPAAAQALSKSLDVPAVLAQLLVSRGIDTVEAGRRFLNPAIDQLHDPYAMAGMALAVARVQSAVAHREPILIYGDYDVDGTVAVVLLKTAIETLGRLLGEGQTGPDVRFHVPHRLREGYGMKSEVVEAAVAAGARLIISVDTGIRAFAAAEAAAALGIDLIVTDHHLPDAARGLPPALAILNPNQDGCAYPCKHLCGAGVAFKLSQALLEANDPARAREKILPSFLKMLAIATIADAVPLVGENRAIAALGIEQLAKPAHAGLRALLALADLDPARRKLTSTDIAFRLAPRINAAGRMDIASEVVEMFTTRDPARARSLAEKLDRLNADRRNTEAEVLAQIDTLLKDDPALGEAPCVVLDGEGWHRGVIGILASRVVERANRPAIVIAHENGEAHGSGRSIPGFHLLDAILLCDAALPLDQITPALYAGLQRLHPTGMDNEDPLFLARNIRVAAPPRILKETHIKLQLADRSNGSNEDKTIPALGWRWAERAAALGVAEGSRIDLAYRLRLNGHPQYGGVELEIEDLCLATESPIRLEPEAM
jgi:single-stranded-DNA-specific exonuclease